jgi:hypothetical protein
MGGGKEIPILISTSAMVGTGTMMASSKKMDPKSNFFIFCLLCLSSIAVRSTGFKDYRLLS